MKQKKVPMRMCVGCHENKTKKELLRIVRVSQKLLDEGKVNRPVCLDASGKLAGRGAYICPSVKCLKAARKAKKLEREFEMEIDDILYDELITKMEDMNGSMQ